jgi:hypothetical protein
MPRKVFVAGEILTAADVNTNLMDQAVQVFDSSAARGSAIPSPTEGMVTYLSDSNLVEAYTGAAFKPVAGVLQVVRATDSTSRTTASTSFTDANISVTITPKSATSVIYLFWSFLGFPATDTYMRFQITDSGNTAVSGAEAGEFGSSGLSLTSVTLIGFSTPGTTSAVTFKGRFRVTSGTGAIRNDLNTGQLIAWEVSA